MDQTGAIDTSATDGSDAETSTDSADITTPVYPTSHPRIYLTPNKARLQAALTANTPTASRFKTTVDSYVAGSDIWGFGAWNAALMGQLTGQSKYCTKAIAVVQQQVSDAEAAIAAGNAPTVANDSYLEIGDMVGDLALTYDWCYSQVTSAQRSHWIAYANQAVWNVWNFKSAKWGSKTFPWSGWATDDPSDNYYYSFLRATMLLGLATNGESSQAQTWLDTFRQTKILDELDPTFTSDLSGGASREGTGYGVAMRRLFELYTFWKDTTGENIATYVTHTRYSMLAMMHQIVPTFDKVAPTGDQSRDSTAALFDYHRDYLLQLMHIFATDTLAGRAKSLLAASSVKQMSQQFMVGYDFINDPTNITATSVSALNTAYRAKGIGELYMRSDWTKTATWLNLIAGPYTQSHAHQDQGSLMIYKGGWLAYDAVIDSHSGLTQDTTAHSLVRIDSGSSPIKQVASTISKLTALHQTKDYVYASSDLTPAYNGNGSIQMVQRDILFLQPNTIIVYDRVNTSSGTTQTWQLASPVKPTTSSGTATFTNAGHTLKVQRLSPSATASIYSYTSNSEYLGGYRYDEKVAGGNNRYLHVLSLDGAVSSAITTGTATQPGVTVNLAGGGTATVLFNRDSAGGVITLNGVTTTLTAAVDSLSQSHL
ncbi:MAG: heparinase II/III family protein [Deltaproteobacteria bacterium]|nr:heparinase II/III family protein [Deltaproteobacteria bacterium]